MQRKRGFTLIELLVVMGIISLLVGLLMPALARARATARLTQEGSKVRQIHQAFLVHAGEFDGRLPLPGLVKRGVDPVLGRVMPNRGPENLRWNHHAALYSLGIMQQYFSPKLLIGTTEVSANVSTKDDYNYERYDPVGAVFWDESLKADLETDCNVSYATMPLAGPRKVAEWRDSVNTNFPALGNRGPEGAEDYDQMLDNMVRSVTRHLHGAAKEWSGQVCYNDNHVQYTKTFWPDGLVYEDGGSYEPDNLFHNDTGAAADDGIDAWLIMCFGAWAAPGSDSVDLYYHWD